MLGVLNRCKSKPVRTSDAESNNSMTEGVDILNMQP